MVPKDNMRLSYSHNNNLLGFAEYLYYINSPIPIGYCDIIFLLLYQNNLPGVYIKAAFLQTKDYMVSYM